MSRIFNKPHSHNADESVHVIGKHVILKIILTYATFAALWILLSDWAVEYFERDPHQIILLSSAKGWLFVVVTSVLLLVLLRKNIAQIAAITEQLSQSERYLLNIINSAGDPIFVKDDQSRVILANDAFCALFERPREKIIGQTLAEYVAPHEYEHFLEVDRQVLRDGRESLVEESFTYKGRSTQTTLTRKTRYTDENGNHFIVGVVRDITERKEAEEKIRKLSLAVEQSPSSIIITDLDANITYVNKGFVEKSGYTFKDVKGRNPRILQSGHTSKTSYDEMWRKLVNGEVWQGEFTNRRKDGSDYIESVSISPVRDQHGQINAYLAVKEDITELKHSAERLTYLAHFDQLTGLPNHTLQEDHFNYAASLARRNRKELAVCFLDLDHFKNINDTLGHSIGDKLLIEVSLRLKAALRDGDAVSRLGGDEFVFILSETDHIGAAHLADKLIDIISTPYKIGKNELNITASIGIAMYPSDGKNLEILSQNADAAMYIAKQSGRNSYSFFTKSMQVNAVRNLRLTTDLKQALERNELQLHYQPQFSFPDKQLIGAEALLRWEHPEFGMLSPVEFIPIAENSGLIIPIGEWVLRTAAAQMKVWQDQGLPLMVIAVNLSAVQFRHANLLDMIINILAKTGLPPNLLELELTEAVAMDEPIAAIELMGKLQEQGVRMSIDDFGTGYSSLSYLKRFRIYKLKIDQSFVRDIATNQEDKAIVISIITMARSLGIRTIAEGVETAEQLAFLEKNGCNEVQGYYFSKPLPSIEFEQYVNQLH